MSDKPLDPGTIELLQELIAINLDTAKGLQASVEAIEDEALQVRFKQVMTQRDRFASELMNYVRTNHEIPIDQGTFMGTLHRWWLNVRTLMEGDEKNAVLEEAERAEVAIASKYAEAVRRTKGSPIHDVLVEQERDIGQGHALIRDLRLLHQS